MFGQKKRNDLQGLLPNTKQQGKKNTLRMNKKKKREKQRKSTFGFFQKKQSCVCDYIAFLFWLMLIKV